MNRLGLHHAYVVTGSKEDHFESLINLVSDHFNMSRVGNPDFIIREYEHLGMDDVQFISSAQSNTSLDKKGSTIFMLKARGIGNDAQNAMLKILEEPRSGVVFFFMLARSDLLLPTFLSRVEMINPIKVDVEEYDIPAFIGFSPALRLEYVQSLISKEDKLKAKGFIDELSVYIHSLWRENRDVSLSRILKELVNVERYILDPSSSMKLLLEHTALLDYTKK